MRTYLVILAACLSWIPQAALAQQPAQFVSSGQKALESSFMGKYFTLLSPIQSDSIEEDDDTSFSFDVPVDVDINVLAACNSYCGDIDIEVTSSAGLVLGSDRNEDATPKVMLDAGRHPGKLNVRVYLRSCNAETCSVATGIYKR